MSKEKVLVVVVPLKPGETVAQATAEVERILAARRAPSGPPDYEEYIPVRHWYDDL